MENSKVTTPKPFCFVLMPFSGEFDDIYQIGIKEACDKAEAYCERVDEQIFSETILDRVYNQIAKADMIIADMTGRNPNVFYEVGYAHALGKLTILLTQNADDIPFDLKHFPHIIYGKKVSVLRDELEKRVKYFVENPSDKSSDNQTGLELYIGDENLALGNAFCIYSSDRTLPVEITVHNSSNSIFTSGDFKIGIITNLKISYPFAEDIDMVRLPTGENLFMLSDIPNLFPDGYATSYIKLINNFANVSEMNKEILQIRLFSKNGSRDFSVRTQLK